MSQAPAPSTWAHRVVVTCEHASNAVPAWAGRLCAAGLDGAAQRALAVARQGHRGFDAGAADLARALARTLGRPPVLGRATRLLVDLNRSRQHPRRFSEFSRALPPAARACLERRLWWAHWQRVARRLAAVPGPVTHLALHSFEPSLSPGRERIDVGLLYDPGRARERRLADALCRALAEHAPALRVRRNAPYRGVADGLPTAIRRRCSDRRYAGCEVEVGQQLVRAPHFAAVKGQLVKALWQACRAASARPNR